MIFRRLDIDQDVLFVAVIPGDLTDAAERERRGRGKRGGFSRFKDGRGRERGDLGRFPLEPLDLH